MAYNTAGCIDSSVTAASSSGVCAASIEGKARAYESRREPLHRCAVSHLLNCHCDSFLRPPCPIPRAARHLTERSPFGRFPRRSHQSALIGLPDKRIPFPKAWCVTRTAVDRCSQRTGSFFARQYPWCAKPLPPDSSATTPLPLFLPFTRITPLSQKSRLTGPVDKRIPRIHVHSIPRRRPCGTSATRAIVAPIPSCRVVC